jgi:hypothetical protein
MIIAVDFDGTIVEHAYPGIGKPIPFAVETLIQLQREGHRIILWSVREGKLLQEALDYCAERGLRFFAANENYPGEDRATAPRKLMADIFIDDRNLGGLHDWGIIYNTIKSMEEGLSPQKALYSHSQPDYRNKDKKKRRFFFFKKS